MKLSPAELNIIRTYFADKPVLRAYVFGSYARGDADENSDIDLLVSFTPEEKITLFQYVHIVNELEKITGKKVDMVEDGKLKTFAVNSANADKILIYERKA